MIYNDNHIDLQQEKQWIEESKADPRAFKSLYTKYYDEIFRFIYRRTGKEVLSAELCSETFYKALLKLPKYTWQNVLFGHWLYRIAANEVKKYYRDRKEVFIIEIDKIQEEIPIEKVINEVDPSHLIWVLNTLSDFELQLIELKYFEHKTFVEVGLLLNMKDSAVKMRIYRLLLKMRELIIASHDEV